LQELVEQFISKKDHWAIKLHQDIFFNTSHLQVTVNIFRMNKKEKQKKRKKSIKTKVEIPFLKSKFSC
jgi:hypothetical protein